jgi:hypothetical protein
MPRTASCLRPRPHPPEILVFPCVIARVTSTVRAVVRSAQYRCAETEGPNPRETQSIGSTVGIRGHCDSDTARGLCRPRFNRDSRTIRLRGYRYGRSAGTSSRSHRCASAARIRLARRLLELGGRTTCVGGRSLGSAARRVPVGAPRMGASGRWMAAASRPLGPALNQTRDQLEFLVER